MSRKRHERAPPLHAWTAARWTLLACSCWELAAGDTQPGSPPTKAKTDIARAADAVAAAQQTAKRLFAQDTPEYTAALRHLVGAMMKAQSPDATRPQIFDILASMRLTPFDRDPKFRSSLNRSIDLSLTDGLIFPYVLNSRPDTENQFPDVVLVKGPGLEICSGIVIKTNRVLTARHCVCSGITVSVGLGAVYSTLGYHPIVNQRPTRQECTAVPTSNVDLGIVYTNDGVAQSDSFPPFATSQLIDAAQSAQVVGYGVSILGSNASAGDRRSASVSVVSKKCGGTGPGADGVVVADSVRFGCVPGITLVAASSTGADQCGGDSGGAFLAVDGSGKRYLAGVVSYPTITSALHGGCGQGGVYVRLDVPQVSSWIARNL